MVDNAIDKTEEKKKKKVNYNIVDKEDQASDEASDSEPSADNLDQDSILKLIPKKFGKNKYLKGVEQTKKKVVKEAKKEKPKMVLMPCNSIKKEKE